MEEIIVKIYAQFHNIYFTIGFFFIILSLTAALLNIGLAQNIKHDMDLKTFIKRWTGSCLSYLLLLILSTHPNLYAICTIALCIIYLICLREITVALKFTGIDLTSITFFINLALKFIEKKGINTQKYEH